MNEVHRAIADEAYRRGVEDAAKVCKARADEWSQYDDTISSAAAIEARKCAKVVRALLTAPPEVSAREEIESIVANSPVLKGWKVSPDSKAMRELERNANSSK